MGENGKWVTEDVLSELIQGRMDRLGRLPKAIEAKPERMTEKVWTAREDLWIGLGEFGQMAGKFGWLWSPL